MLFNYFYRCLQTFITVVLIYFYYHCVTIKRIWWWWNLVQPDGLKKACCHCQWRRGEGGRSPWEFFPRNFQFKTTLHLQWMTFGLIHWIPLFQNFRIRHCILLVSPVSNSRKRCLDHTLPPVVICSSLEPQHGLMDSGGNFIASSSSLPPSLHDSFSLPGQFCRQLKTFLFRPTGPIHAVVTIQAVKCARCKSSNQSRNLGGS